MTWRTISIQAEPSKGHLGQIQLVVKFVQKFEQQSSIMGPQINDPQATILLTSAGPLPRHKITPFLSQITSMPKDMFSIFVNLINDF
jgi:hypothetical protein